MESSVQLNLVVLRSPDMERAVGFYRRLGLELVRHRHGEGPEHYTSTMGGLVFEIYPASPKYPSTAATRIGFRVPSVDETVDRLAAIGTEVLTAPSNSEWGRRAVVRDFDGHVVELVAAKSENQDE